MRIRIVPVLCALSALMISGLAGCGDAQQQPPPGTTGAAGNSGSPGSNGSTEPPGPTTIPDVDIQAVDLGGMEWLYSFHGTDLPVTVKLVDGSSSVGAGAELVTYELDAVSYGDVDADGDEDAVARINRSNDMAFEGLWYVWLAEGPDVVQVKYPIAQTGRCATYVESVVIADGGIELTEFLRIPGLDDSIPCSDPGTGLKKRSITIHEEGPEAWPVQTAPVAAWGGLCPGPRWPDTGPGLVDLWAAPSQGAATAAVAAPDGGAVFEQKDSPLTQRDGWALVGFRVFGVESDVGGTDMACAWALN